MAVRWSLDRIPALLARERTEMLALLARHFDGVDAATFAADLEGKTHVLRLFADSGALAGFSTMDYRRRRIGGEPAALLYSGDTIVDPEEWASTSLGAAWVAAVLDLHAAAGPPAPLWWLLLTSGVRTYRYLTVCIRRYAPAPADRLDHQALALLPTLAVERFGHAVDTGVVRFAQPQRLREHLAAPPPHVLADEAVRLFIERNPGHAEGDELVSLCRLEEANLTGVGRLALRRGRAAAAGAAR
jgi:hypothetical protein